MATEIKNGETLSKGTTYTWFIAKKEKNKTTWTAGIKIALEMKINSINTSSRTVKVNFRRVLYAQYQTVYGINWKTSVPSGASAGYRYKLKLTSSDGNSHKDLPPENTGAQLKFTKNSNNYAKVFEWGDSDREFKYDVNGKCNFTVKLDSWYISYTLDSGSYTNTIFGSSGYWYVHDKSATFKLPSITPLLQSVSISGNDSATAQVRPKSFSIDYDRSKYGSGNARLQNPSDISVTTNYEDYRVVKCTDYDYTNPTVTLTANTTPSNLSGISYSWYVASNRDYVSGTSSNSNNFTLTLNCAKARELYNKSHDSYVVITVRCTATLGSTQKQTSFNISLHKNDYIYWWLSSKPSNVAYITGSDASLYGIATTNLQCAITARKACNGKDILYTYNHYPTDTEFSNITGYFNRLEIEVKREIESIYFYTTQQQADWNVVPSNTNPSYPSTTNPIKLIVKPYPASCNSEYWQQIINNLNAQHYPCYYIPSGSGTALSYNNSYLTTKDFGSYSVNTPDKKYYAYSITPNSEYIKSNTNVQAYCQPKYSVYTNRTINYKTFYNSAYFTITPKDWSIKKITTKNVSTGLCITDLYFDKNNIDSTYKYVELDSGESYSTTIYITRETDKVFYADPLTIEPVGTTEILDASNFTSSDPNVATVLGYGYVPNSSPALTIRAKHIGSTKITVTSKINKVQASFIINIVPVNDYFITTGEESSTYPIVQNYSCPYNSNNDTLSFSLTTNSAYNGKYYFFWHKSGPDNKTICNLDLVGNLRPTGVSVVANPKQIPQDATSQITATVLPHTGIKFTSVADKYNTISGWKLSYSADDISSGELHDASSNFIKKYYANIDDEHYTYNAYVTAMVKSETNSFKPLQGTATITVDARGIKIIPNKLDILQGTFEYATVVTIPSTDKYTYTIDNDNVEVLALSTINPDLSVSDKKLKISGVKIGKTKLVVKSNYTERDYTDTLNIRVIKQFNSPELYLPNRATKDGYYYTEHPKIVFKLPMLDELLSIEDILVDITAYDSSSNIISDNTYSSFENNNLFSMNYNQTFNSTEEMFANCIDNDNAYCVFSDINNNYYSNSSIAYLVVTVMFKSSSELCEDKLTSITLYKQTIPQLPAVNSYMKASDLNDFYTAYCNIVSQVAFSNSNYAIQISSLGIKNEPISVYPFYVALTTLKAILNDIYNKAHSCSNRDSELPEYLSPTTIRTPYYSNKISNNNAKLSTIANASVDYPIMVDDSADYVYNDENWINEFKNTNFYNEFTVSPLSEINKAISKF